MILSLLETTFAKAVEAAFGSSLPVEVAPCQQEMFGHYQCNSPMRFAKEMQRPPRVIAQEIIQHIPKEGIIDKLEIAGPGFINITLSSSFLSERLNAILQDPFLGMKRPSVPQKMIIEFSSPNVAKELHVGHLRSTIIGECLARLFEFLGHDVLRLNHIGDWGTQFGMLIAYMKQHIPEVFQGTKEASLSDLQTWYKASKVLFDQDPLFKKRAQLEVVQLQNREEESIKAWERICAISRTGFQEIYHLLDVHLEERGESFYNPYLSRMVEDLKKRGIAEESQGAQCIFIEGFSNREGDLLPLMIQKSDGAFNYDTTDLAALHYRIQIEKKERIIYVVDLGQSLHFQLVFKAAEKAGYWDPKKVRLDHVSFGLVLGPDGKKFKTRSGETEKLIDLLHEAVSHAEKIILERTPHINRQEAHLLAQRIGIAAVKYADLSTQRNKDYAFSYDRMLKFEGNTAVFLLYSYVRIMGIKRKVHPAQGTAIDLQHPSEVTLGLHLLRFPDILESIADDLMPHRLCEYLFELAEKFNAFFRDCRVEGSEEQGARLSLCEITGKILQQGLSILGITTVDRM